MTLLPWLQLRISGKGTCSAEKRPQPSGLLTCCLSQLYHISSTTMWEHSTVRFPIFCSFSILSILTSPSLLHYFLSLPVCLTPALTLISAHPISQWITYTHCSLEALWSPGPHHQTQKDVACCPCPGQVTGFSLSIFSITHRCQLWNNPGQPMPTATLGRQASYSTATSSPLPKTPKQSDH